MKPCNKKQESLLDGLIRKLRLRKVKRNMIPCNVLCDLGSGYRGLNLLHLSKYFEKGIGIDKEVDQQNIQKIDLLSANLDSVLPLGDSSVDCIISLALIEHLQNLHVHFRECYRILKGGGSMLLTTPTKKAKPVLEFFAFQLGLISEEAILDHKEYFNKKEIIQLLILAGFSQEKISHKYFQLGFNNFVKVTK